jgi:hypothetical protein
MQFVAPAICLLAGLGAGLVLERIGRPKLRVIALVVSVVALLIDPIVALARDAARPYRFAQDHEAREMARQFWPSAPNQAEIACVRRDFGIAGRRNGSMKLTAYLCNQRMYTRKWRARRELDWAAVSDRHPLRVVLYDASLADGPAIPRWLATMQAQLDLVRTESFAPKPVGRSASAPVWMVYEFRPKARGVARSASPLDASIR